MHRGFRRLWLAATAGGLLCVGLAVVANAVVVLSTADDRTDDAALLERAQVAVVPGSRVNPDGTLGGVVGERVAAAVRLYEAGTVEKILVSGDNGAPEYNEPEAMLAAVLAAGVAPEDVFTDYAGFDTWHTMRRARLVFEVDSAVVVSQDPFLARAVHLGRAAGLDVQGYVAGDAGPPGREVLARVSGFGEALLRPDVVGGPALPITGDGRTSWSEADRDVPGVTGTDDGGSPAPGAEDPPAS